jgi:uncharacterized protein (TIRG00374 family)
VVRRAFRRHFVTAIKLALPVVIIGWLLASLDRQRLVEVWEHPKNWWCLIGGFVIATIAVCISFYRWYLLVRALDIPFRVRDAFRLSFVAFLFNFVAAGSVGGDLFKAIFIAREQPKRRTEAIATLVVDRVVGMYALLLVCSVAILSLGRANTDDLLRMICDFTLLVTACAFGVLPILMIPRFGHGPLARAMVRLPRIGQILARLRDAFHAYRRKRDCLILVTLISISVHVLLVVSIHLCAVGLLQQPPTLGEHMVIVPLSMVAGSIPFTPGGLGTFEAAMQALYALVAGVPREDGTVVALVYRLITLGIAGIGVLYYWYSRREMNEVLEEAERETEIEQDDAVEGPEVLQVDSQPAGP